MGFVSITLLALGTSSCRAFILSAILSLRNCHRHKNPPTVSDKNNKTKPNAFPFCCSE